LLLNRNFLLLWSAYAVSAMGDHLSEMAILKTQNALGPGIDATPLDARMTFLFFVPFFLFGLPAGWLADRFARRTVMILADVVRCGIMLSFATLMAWTTPIGTWGPFLPLLGVGLFAAAFSPARAAMLPTLVRRDQLVRANGMISGLGIIATMISLQVGGVLADHYDVRIAFRLDAVTYAASAVLLACMVLPRRPSAKRAPRAQPTRALALGWRGLADGVRYARQHRRVAELIAIAALVWFCGPLVKCAIPGVVKEVYGGTYATVGTYRMLLGVGFITGAVGITVLGDALRSEIAITWGLVGVAGSIGLFAVSALVPPEWAPTGLPAVIGGVSIVGAGTFGVSVMASFNALLQRITPNHYRGRIFGVKDLCSTLALLVATGALGIPRWTGIDRWVGVILALVSVLTFAAGMLSLKIRLRRGPLRPAYMAASHLIQFIARFWWRMRRIGRPTIPRSGPVIVTANHRCHADPFLLHAAAPYRPISFLIAEEYTRFPLVRWIVRAIESIPVRRDGRDVSATKHAIRLLREGKVLGIFIEGGIVRPGKVGRPRDGVAMMALKTGALVVPVYISGTNYEDNILLGFLRRHRAEVRYGPPVDLSDLRRDDPDREMVRAATERIYAAINALAP
jgi:1-acyl-sn-glycerol-3-phosphate acyltransferase